MSNAYRLVQWNRHKKVYDAVLGVGIALYVVGFVGVGKLAAQQGQAISDEVLLIRALATCAFALLTIILCIGPLARISHRFAPLLYNRRHLGVTMCFVALVHAVLATGYYGGFAGVNPLKAVLGSGTFRSVSGFPFEWFGLVSLVILLVMAATSHDFWLANLGARVWKWLHMSVYVAYASLVLHVALGFLQSETSLVYAVLVGASVVLVGGLHAIVGFREWRMDRAGSLAEWSTQDRADAKWIDVASIEEIPESRAKVVCLRDAERIAVFRNGESFSAVTNVCAHQGGPLGEGKIVGGCITCPWHGYQYLPHNGQSPPPFTEKIATYEVRVRGDRVEVNSQALPAGTAVEPAKMPRGCGKKVAGRHDS
ncbi:MAG: ferric reductase-like transmembrane domain-containing protein [Phycisphaerales bacterium]